MKRFITLLIAGAMILSFSSCASSGDTETEQTDVTATQETIKVESDTLAASDNEEQTIATYTEAETKTETETETEEAIPEMVIIKMTSASSINGVLKKSLIFRMGDTYSAIRGERYLAFTEECVPYSTGTEVYLPAEFIINDPELSFNGAVDMSAEYLSSTDLYDLGIGVFFDEELQIAIVTEGKLDIANEKIEAELAKNANNMLSLGTAFSAATAGIRPVIFTTDEMLAESRAMIEQQQQPWYSTWLNVKNLANAALSAGPKPDTGKSATQYRLAACKDFINARYLALAYYYTGEDKYLDAAVSFLMAYAKPMLGTDRYLDYSAATTDGQADIGLNIAIPLTTACDVYSIICTYMDEADKTTFKDWVRAEADLCVKGHKYWIVKDCYNKQYGNNHLTCHLMGILAASYILEDDKLLDYALNSGSNDICLTEMLTRAILMEGDEVYSVDTDSNFAVGEIYDRYRVVQNNGFGYAMYHTKFLTYSAIILLHNGLDLFSYIGKNGENLLLPYKAYSEYLIQNDITLNGGHYTNDKSMFRQDALNTYLIGYYAYGDATQKAVIDAIMGDNISSHETETFGVSGQLLFGAK